MTYQPFPAFADWSAPFDPALVDQYAERLTNVRKTATPEAQARALEVATRYAAVDTGAIEGLYTTDRGFTTTIATQSEHWQRALDQRGEQVKRSIQDALDGYEYVLDAVTGRQPITAQWIRQLHGVITMSQETYAVVVELNGQFVEDHRPLPHGEYKTLPNNPTNAATGRLHDYAPPADTSAEVLRLCDELASDEFTTAHPVIQAAYAHYAYVCIHPFADGNGRVARALASAFLYRRPGVPLVIFADQRAAYIDVLEHADDGHPQDFVQFIEQRVIDTVQLVELTMAKPPTPGTDGIASLTARQDAADLVRTAARRVGLASDRLASVASEYLRRAVDGYHLPPVIQVNISRESVSYLAGEGLLQNPGTNLLVLQLNLEDIEREYLVLPSAPGTGGPELVLRNHPDNGTSLDVWLREIDPTETVSLNLKLEAWASNEAATLLEDVNQALL